LFDDVLNSTCEADDERAGDSTGCCMCSVSHGVLYAGQSSCSLCFFCSSSSVNFILLCFTCQSDKSIKTRLYLWHVLLHNTPKIKNWIRGTGSL